MERPLGKEKALPQRSGMTVYSLAFSPDGKTLAWGGGIDPREVDTTYREGFEDIPKATSATCRRYPASSIRVPSRSRKTAGRFMQRSL